MGQHLKAAGSNNERYQAWIELYGGEDFDRIVQQVLDLMDELAHDLDQTERHACKKHFITTSRMEYMFWDSPVKGAWWPC
jgi:thiaminase (transcriptional activator TenA)